ncbi:MAG: hypothetical protein U9N40_10040 [Euryarchaeota archaeon]|nr:hypothetical protein [Euryarchaeota archaeon]
MGGIFKRLFGKKEEPKPVVVRFSELDSWISDYEAEIRGVLLDTAMTSRDIVTSATEELRIHVHDLGEIKVEAEFHPKLIRVVEHSIPSFISVMDVTLGKGFSESPDEYYSDVVAFVNATAKNMKSQGRYITGVLPEEMKKIRETLAVVGRQINELNEVFGPSRSKLSALAEIRRLYESVNRSVDKYHSSGEEIEALKKELDDCRSVIESLNSQISEIESGREYNEAVLLNSEIEALKKEKQHLRDDYSRLVSLTSNAFRKAEYFAGKSGDRKLADEIRTFWDMLKKPSSVDNSKLLSTYGALYPHLKVIFDKKEGILKNKNEQQLFSAAENLSEKIRSLCSGYSSISADLSLLSAKAKDLPAFSKKEACESKRAELTEKCRNTEKQIVEVTEMIKKTEDEIPLLISSLQEKLISTEDRPVELLVDIKNIPEILNHQFVKSSD